MSEAERPILDYCEAFRGRRSGGDSLWICSDENDDEDTEGRKIRAPDAVTAAKRYAEQECSNDCDLYAAYDDGRRVFVKGEDGETRSFTIRGETTVVFRAEEFCHTCNAAHARAWSSSAKGWRARCIECWLKEG